MQNDPITHDPFTHDPITHDPLSHGPITHDPLTHDPITHVNTPCNTVPKIAYVYLSQTIGRTCARISQREVASHKALNVIKPKCTVFSRLVMEEVVKIKDLYQEG